METERSKLPKSKKTARGDTQIHLSKDIGGA
jgi:hypothetical protein